MGLRDYISVFFFVPLLAPIGKSHKEILIKKLHWNLAQSFRGDSSIKNRVVYSLKTESELHGYLRAGHRVENILNIILSFDINTFD